MRYNDEKITYHRLKEMLDYNSETGVFTWSASPNRNDLLGKVAGGITECGYIKIKIDGVKHRAHRLAWLYVYGKFPEHCIDHINGNCSDNRIENLREAKSFENGQNRKASKSSAAGLIGVSKLKNKKWVAVICLHRKKTHLGTFNTPEEAHEAYLNAKLSMHTFNPIIRQIQND